ncbi:MAG: hypothetical protein JW384_04163 [Nitrosomonadaceae bacterium]|nr:hypothetical protein [Nitrosomonadaceae bacterium]
MVSVTNLSLKFFCEFHSLLNKATHERAWADADGKADEGGCEREARVGGACDGHTQVSERTSRSFAKTYPQIVDKLWRTTVTKQPILQYEPLHLHPLPPLRCLQSP